MKFSQMPYERPLLEDYQTQFDTLIQAFNEASSAQAQREAMDAMNQLRSRFSTLSTLVSVRHSQNTLDPFYSAEQDYMDQVGPQFQALQQAFYHALIDAKYKQELIEMRGELLFKIAEQSLSTFDESIIPLLQKENSLTTEYGKLLASANIPFEGETYALSQMAPFMQDKDRARRQAAADALWGFFAENETTLDRIYDDLVRVRHDIATQLGFENFTALGYARMGRLDYNADDVRSYREQVKTHLVPLWKKLKERQKKRLGLDTLKYYDNALKFLTGNPTPKGDEATLVQAAATMYREMSPETNVFFQMMQDQELMDLDARKGKEGGGYCTTLDDYQVPFIFANFNGTAHDVDVLTHEAGHAFQMYQSAHHAVPEYRMATYEASEIHSMSMEFLAWPWMPLFFKEDTEKYKFDHIAGSLSFIPYGCLVDEFQHGIYENPHMTAHERKTLWRNLEKTYLPLQDYDGNDFLERGGYWFIQSHIFQVPFYYIDYTLAQVCALQYWDRAQADFTKAWQSYLTLCQAGGSRTFTGLLELAQLNNPFEPGSIAKILPRLESYLNGIDDSQW